MKVKKLLNIEYGCIHGSFWMYYSIISSFCSVFLLDKGFNDAQIGIVFALGNVVAVLCQPFLADFADRTERFSLTAIVQAMGIFLLVITAGLFVFNGKTTGLAIIFILMMAGHMATQPLVNSLAFRISASGVHINFGLTRSVGSLAYSIIAVVLGVLVEKYGVITIPLTGEVTAVMFILSVFFIGYHFKKNIVPASRKSYGKKAKTTDSKDSFEENEKINLLLFIKRNRLFVALNLGVLGLFFSNAILNNYMMQIVSSVGGDSSELGIILAAMALMEIPTLVFFDRLKMSFRCQTMMKIGAIGFTLKIMVIWLSGSVGLLIAVQIFQLFAFGLFYPAMVYFINETMEKGEAVKGQALFTTVITISTVISSLAGGLILDRMGAKMLTFAAFLVTAAGAVIVILIVDRIKQRKIPVDENSTEYN